MISIFSFEKDMLASLAKNRKVYGFIKTRNFIDIGVPEDYLKAKEDCVNWI